MQVGAHKGTLPADAEGCVVVAEERVALYFAALLHCVDDLLFRAESNGRIPTQRSSDFAASHLVGSDERTLAIKRMIVGALEYSCPEYLGDEGDDIRFLARAIELAEAIASNNQAETLHGNRVSEFDRNTNLMSIFNCVNGHDDKNEVGHPPYRQILKDLADGLRKVPLSMAGTAGLSDLLEDVVGTVPASTNPEGLIDVPLFDYAKSVACFASCIREYSVSHKGADFTRYIEPNTVDPFAEPMFLLLSCDLSGIQNFIYSISGSGALRQLRARSLYLELLMEVIIDEILARTGLCR